MDDPVLRKPPPHLDGNLLLQDSKKFGKRTWREKHIVVIRDTLFIQKAQGKNAREEISKFEQLQFQKDNKDTKSIPLKQVEISESIARNVPEGFSVNWAFQVKFSDETNVFLAASFEDQRRWVEGLQYVKKFWMRKLEAEMLEEKTKKQHNVPTILIDEKFRPSASSSDKFEVSVTGFDGKVHTCELPKDARFTQLYRAINGDGPCADCSLCLIREKAAQLWAMDTKGSDLMVRKLEPIYPRFEQDCEFFLIEHGYKLMVVQFPDGKFMALPVQPTITAKEVTNIDKFVAKLTKIGCTNFALFLKKEDGQELQFTDDERPLESFYKNQDGIFKRDPEMTGHLLLRNKSLKPRSDSGEPDDNAVHSGQFRAQKIITDDAQKHVSQELNRMRKMQANRPEIQMEFSDEHFSSYQNLDRVRSQSSPINPKLNNPFMEIPGKDSDGSKSVPAASRIEPKDLNPVYLSSSLTDRYTRIKSFKIPDADQTTQEDKDLNVNEHLKPEATSYSIKRENSQIRNMFAGLISKSENKVTSQSNEEDKVGESVSSTAGSSTCEVTERLVSSDSAKPDQKELISDIPKNDRHGSERTSEIIRPIDAGGINVSNGANDINVPNRANIVSVPIGATDNIEPNCTSGIIGANKISEPNSADDIIRPYGEGVIIEANGAADNIEPAGADDIIEPSSEDGIIETNGAADNIEPAGADDIIEPISEDGIIETNGAADNIEPASAGDIVEIKSTGDTVEQNCQYEKIEQKGASGVYVPRKDSKENVDFVEKEKYTETGEKLKESTSFVLKREFQELKSANPERSCEEYDNSKSQNIDRLCDNTKVDSENKSVTFDNNNIDMTSSAITEQLEEYLDDSIGLICNDIDTVKGDIHDKQQTSVDYDDELMEYLDDNIACKNMKGGIEVNIEQYEANFILKPNDKVGVILPRSENDIAKMTTLRVQDSGKDHNSDSDSDASSIEGYMETHYGSLNDKNNESSQDFTSDQHEKDDGKDTSCMVNIDSENNHRDSHGVLPAKTGGAVVKIISGNPGLNTREFECRQMRSSPVLSKAPNDEHEADQIGRPVKEKIDLYSGKSRHRRRGAFREGSIYKEVKQDVIKRRIQEKLQEKADEEKNNHNEAAVTEADEHVKPEKPEVPGKIEREEEKQVSGTNGVSLPRNLPLEETTRERQASLPREQQASSHKERSASLPFNHQKDNKAASLPSRGSLKCMSCNECNEGPFQVNTFKLIVMVLEQCSKQSVVSSRPNEYDYICLSGVHLRNTAGVWELADNTSFHTESELTDSLEIEKPQEPRSRDVIASKVAKERQVMMGNGICCHWLPKKNGLRGKWRVLRSEKKSFAADEKDEFEEELTPRPTSCPPLNRVDDYQDKLLDDSSAFMTKAKKRAPSMFKEVIMNLKSATSSRSSSRASSRPSSPDPVSVYVSLELASIRENLLVPLNRAVNQIRQHFISGLQPHHATTQQHKTAATQQLASLATQQHQLGDDTVTPAIGWLIRKDLCSALAGLLLLGMKNDSVVPQFILLGKPTRYNLWSLMKDVARKCVDEPVILQMVNIIEESPFLFDDDLRYRCFVCETLNCPNEAGREKLFMTWYKRFLASKQVIEKFYKPGCIWRLQDQLETSLFIEETCLILSHLNEYTFNLQADFEYKELKRRHVEENGDLDFTLQRQPREVDMGVFTFE